MHIALGIDTGGTYTDAVLVNHDTGALLASTKALTTHYDLAIGISEAIAHVFEPAALREEALPVSPRDVSMVGLSTTLATNAIVEGQGSPVCLILIGYDPLLIQQHGFERELVTPHVVHIAGGHDGDGNEQVPLDEAAARAAIAAYRDRVAAFAVSGYFSVRNAAHELRVKALIGEMTGSDGGLPIPVTCGHELTTRLNSIRRATTVALNARLIPVLRELILTVRQTLDTQGVTAPLMIVKGDGSLVKWEWALQRPIETILSGPAASVVGAWHIAGRKDIWVVDVGGTTTDIAALRDGRPRLNPEGAQVGGWRTMVEAADVHTVGLGGDSQVSFNAHGGSADQSPLKIGPQRVLPLCRLGSAYPEVLEELEHQRTIRKTWLKPLMGEFLLPRRRSIADLSASDQALVRELEQGPRSLVWYAQRPAYRSFLRERVERLVAQQVVMRCSFTPTDALHVLGRYQEWNTAVARVAAELLAAQVELSVEEFCASVVAGMSDRVATELVSKVLHDEVGVADWDAEPLAVGLLARALNRVRSTDLACSFTLLHPVIAVGAPVEAYLPRTAEQLHTELVIPKHAGVANAIGAVAGSVVQRAHLLIRPVDFEEHYRLHAPGTLVLDQTDFDTVADALAYAESTVPGLLVKLTQDAGADQVEVQLVREDRTGTLREKIDQSIFLESALTFTAVGRPAAISR